MKAQREVAGFAALFAATVATYLPVLRAGLVWDDDGYVTRPSLRGWDGLRRIWFSFGSTEQYYPVLHSAFWCEHRLWGDSAWAYHLLNVVLHAAGAGLLVLVLRRLAVPGAWLAGLLFALHPLCAESVAWISEEKNTLSLVFYLLAAWFYLRGGAGSYACATLWFILALLSKSTTAVLPGVLLVLAWWQRGKVTWRADVRPLAPWLVLGAGDGLLTGWVERVFIGAHGSAFALSFLQRGLVAGRVCWFYLGKLLWPAHLVFIYPRWQPDAADPIQYLYPAGVLAVLGGVYHLRRRSRAPLAVALLYVGSLFPVLGFFNVFAFIYSFVADHWAYLAALPIFAAAAALLTACARRCRLSPLAVTAVGTMLIAPLALRTWAQAATYRNPETFYEAILRQNPRCWLAEENLGVMRAREGRLPEAIGYYEAALRLNGALPQNYTNYGNALARERRWEEAFAAYAQALGAFPGYEPAEENWGTALAEAGRFADAIAHYQAALRLNPNEAEAHYLLGNVYLRQARLAAAAAEYRAALALDPNHSLARRNLTFAERYLSPKQARR